MGFFNTPIEKYNKLKLKHDAYAEVFDKMQSYTDNQMDKMTKLKYKLAKAKLKTYTTDDKIITLNDKHNKG